MEKMMGKDPYEGIGRRSRIEDEARKREMKAMRK
jgi:hypothetical protein